jgi:hypothetical protein
VTIRQQPPFSLPKAAFVNRVWNYFTARSAPRLKCKNIAWVDKAGESKLNAQKMRLFADSFWPRH